ncbi:MAG: hypothetical protein AB8A49_01040 [Prochlorococcus sp.]
MGLSEQSVNPIPISPPSFSISKAAARSVEAVRWDRINSREVIEKARKIYFNYLSNSISGPEPIGVVLSQKNGKGRVVFDLPTLLPNEHYLKLELLRSRLTRSRLTQKRNPGIDLPS